MAWAPLQHGGWGPRANIAFIILCWLWSSSQRPDSRWRDIGPTSWIQECQKILDRSFKPATENIEHRLKNPNICSIKDIEKENRGKGRKRKDNTDSGSCQDGKLAWAAKILFQDHRSKHYESIGLPWWRSGWESACQCRGHGFEPWSGKIPHAMEQQSLCATTTEPARLEPVLRNKRGHDSERPAHCDEE